MVGTSGLNAKFFSTDPTPQPESLPHLRDRKLQPFLSLVPTIQPPSWGETTPLYIFKNPLHFRQGSLNISAG